MKKIKRKVKEFYLITCKETGRYTQLVAITENNDEYIMKGDYCGGIPASSWHKLDFKLS